MTSTRRLALAALLAVALAVPSAAGARNACLAPEAAGTIATALGRTALPAGWKVLSARTGLQDVRIVLSDPEGGRRTVRLAGTATASLAAPADAKDRDGIPADVVDALARAASGAATADAWAPCPDRSDRAPGVASVGDQSVVPRWLALVVAHFRMLLLLAGLGLVLYRSTRCRGV